MARVNYVDVAIPADRKKRGKHKTHVVFDGGRVFRVRRLTELEDASEIYIEALFPEVYRKACEILGVKNSVELAILVLELPLNLPLNGLKGLLGFTPSQVKITDIAVN